MSRPVDASPAVSPAPSYSAPACERSLLPPWLRLAITFAVLFALKWGLAALAWPVAAQVLVLLAAATFLAWRFWWNCGTDRRGPVLMIATLWVAGLAKILLQ